MYAYPQCLLFFKTSLLCSQNIRYKHENMVLFALVLQQKQLPSWSEVVFLLSILVAYKASGKPETLLMWPLSYSPTTVLLQHKEIYFDHIRPRNRNGLGSPLVSASSRSWSESQRNKHTQHDDIAAPRTAASPKATFYAYSSWDHSQSKCNSVRLASF